MQKPYPGGSPNTPNLFSRLSSSSKTGGGGILDNFKLPNSIAIRIILCIIFTIVIGIIFYYLYNYLSKKYNTGYKANSEHINSSTDSSNECEMLLFTANWCPHCRAAKPIWEEVKNEYKDKTINGQTIVFTDVDCTNESPDVSKMMDQYKIEGFPTIKLIKNGQVIEFDAKVTKANLEQFINTAV